MSNFSRRYSRIHCHAPLAVKRSFSKSMSFRRMFYISRNKYEAENNVYMAASTSLCAIFCVSMKLYALNNYGHHYVVAVCVCCCNDAMAHMLCHRKFLEFN